MVINTMGYVDLVQNKINALDVEAKKRYLDLNPDYPFLNLSDQANYLLVNKLHEKEELPEQLVEYFPNFKELKEEIKVYQEESDKRTELLLNGTITTPEFTEEELKTLLLITEEELKSCFMDVKTYLKEVINGKEA